jgi:hypothetical protein
MQARRIGVRTTDTALTQESLLRRLSMDLGKNTALFLLAAIAVFLMSTCSAQDYLAVVGSFQYTKDATGFGYGLVENQSSRPSLGGGAEYRKIWRANGISVAYNLATTDAKFTAQGGKIQWGMLRHEINGGYVRTWHRNESPITSYAKVGAGVFITDGGWAPGGIVGLDHQFEIVTEVGTELKLPKGLALRSGCELHFFRAPNFSDSQYHGGRTVMVEPRMGIVWAWR